MISQGRIDTLHSEIDWMHWGVISWASLRCQWVWITSKTLSICARIKLILVISKRPSLNIDTVVTCGHFELDFFSPPPTSFYNAVGFARHLVAKVQPSIMTSLTYGHGSWELMRLYQFMSYFGLCLQTLIIYSIYMYSVWMLNTIGCSSRIPLFSAHCSLYTIGQCTP
jgi:hypothetical protein